MKKYIPIDFDEKGKVVLGNAKNTPTSNGFIPTTWTPGESGDGNGIKSITITPAIATTPALDSLFPIYYDDLTDEEKENGVNLEFTVNGYGTYHFDFTPTSSWYIADSDNMEFMDQGAPLSYDFVLSSPQVTGSANMFLANGNTQDTATKYFPINVMVYVTQ